jgi:hypothetical protein
MWSARTPLSLLTTFGGRFRKYQCVEPSYLTIPEHARQEIDKEWVSGLDAYVDPPVPSSGGQPWLPDLRFAHSQEFGHFFPHC